MPSSSSDLTTTTTTTSSRTKKKNQPNDGPTTLGFESDDFVKTWLMQQQQEEQETYGLVLVAGWPPSAAWRQTYLDCVRPCLVDCFPNDNNDNNNNLEQGSTAAVYVYPPEALHVTLATFWSIHQTQEQPLTLDQRGTLEHHVQAVVERTWQRYEKEFHGDNNDSNSNTTIALEIESAQIGSKAGILLWKDTTDGRIDTFRTILQSECQAECESLRQRVAAGETTTTTTTTTDHTAFVAQALSAVKVPNIIHSSVLRFATTPRTDPTVVQETFRRTILLEKDPHSTIISQPNVLDSITLVREKRPYMHVPADDRHIAWRKCLSAASKEG